MQNPSTAFLSWHISFLFMSHLCLPSNIWNFNLKLCPSSWRHVQIQESWYACECFHVFPLNNHFFSFFINFSPCKKALSSWSRSPFLLKVVCFCLVDLIYKIETYGIISQSKFSCYFHQFLFFCWHLPSTANPSSCSFIQIWVPAKGLRSLLIHQESRKLYGKQLLHQWSMI